MPTPVPHKCLPHTLVNIGGTLFGTGADSEIWQVGIRVMQSASQTPLSDPAGYVATIGPLVNSWFTATDVTLTTFGVFSNAQLTYVKANNIGSNALYTGTGGVYSPSGTVNGGGTATGVLPPILTLATTLTTNIRSGLASKGRVYIPWSIAATSGYRYVTQQSAANRRVKALLAILAQSGVAPCVASILPASDSRTPAMYSITGVRTGDVIDVQRRRKNKLRESYVALAFP